MKEDDNGNEVKFWCSIISLFLFKKLVFILMKKYEWSVSKILR